MISFIINSPALHFAVIYLYYSNGLTDFTLFYIAYKFVSHAGT